MHTIPIFGAGDDFDALAALPADRLPAGARLTARKKQDGVNLDPATLELIITTTKDVLVAAIAALGPIWAAKVAARAATHRSEPTPPEPSKVRPVVEIDTMTDSYVVELDEPTEQRLREVVPDNVKTVLSIRLRFSGSR